jgi:hypothetical protein
MSDWITMFSSRTVSFVSPTSNDVSSVSSRTESISSHARSPPFTLRQLMTENLDDNYRNNRNRSFSRYREPFRIPRPILSTSGPAIHVTSQNNERRSTNERIRSTPLDSTSDIHVFEQPFYQIRPPSMPIPIQYSASSSPFVSLPSNNCIRRKKQKKYVQEKTPGLCTTFFSSVSGAFAVCIYLLSILAVPIAKLLLGILYRDECPVNRNIPLYMIVSGGAGLTIILCLLLASTCAFCRSSIQARKTTHTFMIGTIACARGLQATIALFLFIWFFFGNIWVFGARYRIRTDYIDDKNSTNENYCHPTLYWFAFYVLISTYVIALLLCFMKFCMQLFFCGVCDTWKRAFS